MFLWEFFRAFVRSGTDVGREGLACNLCSSSSQRCSMGLRSGLCAGQIFNTKLIQPFLYGPCFVHSHAGIEPSPNCSHKVRSIALSKMCADALRFLFTRNKGPSPNPEKQPHTSMPPPPQLGHCQSPVAACFTPRHLTLAIVPGDVKLACSCSAVETHSIKLTVIVLILTLSPPAFFFFFFKVASHRLHF